MNMVKCSDCGVWIRVDEATFSTMGFRGVYGVSCEIGAPSCKDKNACFRRQKDEVG